MRGNEIEKYFKEYSSIYLYDNERNRIKIRVHFALLFSERKVLAEKFSRTHIDKLVIQTRNFWQ